MTIIYDNTTEHRIQHHPITPTQPKTKYLSNPIKHNSIVHNLILYNTTYYPKQHNTHSRITHSQIPKSIQQSTHLLYTIPTQNHISCIKKIILRNSYYEIIINKFLLQQDK